MAAPAPAPYVQRVLALYRATPATRGSVRRADRLLAVRLHDRGVPLQIVQTALLLAAARRIFRPVDAPPLPPVASLHYFLPVIDEVLSRPPDPGYLHHLRHRMLPLAPELVADIEHPLP